MGCHGLSWTDINDNSLDRSHQISFPCPSEHETLDMGHRLGTQEFGTIEGRLSFERDKMSLTVMDDSYGSLSWMTFMDDFHRITLMDDFHG